MNDSAAPKPPDLKPIPLIDLQAQRSRIEGPVTEAVMRVLAHGAYIMGPEVRELESQLAAFCGVKHVVSCGNGTDALQLLLMAHGIGRGDAVFLPAFTFTATTEVVALLGATPVLVDVESTSFNIDTVSLEAAVQEHRHQYNKAAVIVVDLFGQPANYRSINALAGKHDLFVIGDAAQSFGAEYQGGKVGTLCSATATSFFPAKPLGCYGDGGALLSDDDAIADKCRSLRAHGKGGHKYDIVNVGMNSRLDTIQAAILLEKLKIFGDEISARNRIATKYHSLLHNRVDVPSVPADRSSVWAQYTIRVEARDEVAAALKRRGIPTAVYYPNPLNKQTAYSGCPLAPGGVPVSEHLSKQVLSLPMHPYLDDETQVRIAEACAEAVR